MRKLAPCMVTGLRFDVEIPEEDELQITVLGAVVRLRHPLPGSMKPFPLRDISNGPEQHAEGFTSTVREEPEAALPRGKVQASLATAKSNKSSAVNSTARRNKKIGGGKKPEVVEKQGLCDE